MRIGILADIHGNLPAFEATIEHLRHQRVDQIIIAGDVVIGSPDSAACWQLAQELGCPIIRGNHERYISHHGTNEGSSHWDDQQFAPLRWAAEQFEPTTREEIARLPLYLRLPDAPDLLIVHASLRADRDTVYAHTPDEEVAAMFPGVTERVIVRAHNHFAQTRLWRGHSIVTAGSVGLSLDCEPTAKYMIMERKNGEWRWHHYAVEYDLDAALRRFHETGYLDATGPIGRLYMREVATASYQIVPFLKAYQRWNKTNSITLEDAFQRWCLE